MPRAKSHAKKIACLETLWEEDLEEDRLSVLPMLKLLARRGIKFTHLTCNTKDELAYNLNKLSNFDTKAEYGILYLAFHGYPAHICLDDGSNIHILDDLAPLMGKNFAKWVIHFGTCSTINTEKSIISAFINSTETSMVIGYTQDVDWIETAALDLILFDWLQYYKNMKTFWQVFSRKYGELIAITGMQAFYK